MAYSKAKKGSGKELQELREDIRNGSFKKVYLLYGNEDYLVQQWKHDLIRAIVDPEDTMNLNIHREERPDWGLLQDQMLSMPFFAERRLVVLEDTKLFRAARKKSSGDNEQDPEDGQMAEIDPENGAGLTSENMRDPEDESASAFQSDSAYQTNEGNRQKPSDRAAGEDLGSLLTAFLPKLPDTTVLLFVEQPDEQRLNDKPRVSVDRRGKLYKAIAKYGLAVEFKHPTPGDIQKWVLARFGKEKIRITQPALDAFLQMSGTQMSHVSTECEKLISYAGHGGELQEKDVRALVSEITEGKIFRMIDAVAKHDRTEALSLYDELLRLKESPIKILILLMRQFDKMFQVKSLLETGGYGAVYEQSGMNDWQMRGMIALAESFSAKRLHEAVEACADMQQSAQSGKIDMRLGLELLIIKLSA